VAAINANILIGLNSLVLVYAKGGVPAFARRLPAFEKQPVVEVVRKTSAKTAIEMFARAVCRYIRVMSEVAAPALTDLIDLARQGNQAAQDDLFAAVYPQLRHMARDRLRRHQRNTLLDTTELVHESYMRFVQAGRLKVEDRGHFIAYAAKVMRSVIVDTVRERLAQRRGGAHKAMTLDSQIADDAAGGKEILAVHDALAGLAREDPRLAQVVELRYFAGFNDEQVAEALGVAERTVRRDWQKARLLLAEALA
jgi:RNA polymerase sigma factor (TIGR02999 family)